jgi:hypothetical protein
VFVNFCIWFDFIFLVVVCVKVSFFIVCLIIIVIIQAYVLLTFVCGKSKEERRTK